jgi:hypothetical protein
MNAHPFSSRIARVPRAAGFGASVLVAIAACWGAALLRSTPQQASVAVDGGVAEHEPSAASPPATPHLAPPTAAQPRDDARPAPVVARARVEAVDPDELAEDEAMRRADTEPELRQWRIDFAKERQDEAWTQQVLDDVSAESERLHGAVRVSDLSCRQTVCRMHLQFADQLDARAFIEAPRARELRYAFQGLDPDFDGEGFDRSDFTYELLIKRAAAPQTTDTASASSNDEGLYGSASPGVESAVVVGPERESP